MAFYCLHACNECFFKLCILDCGRFLRFDSCSAEKERFDYAQVFIATSTLEIINCSESILIDGEMVTVKILEGWGFNMGDDACLYEDDEGSNDEQTNLDDVRVDQELEVNGNFLVDKIVHDSVVSEGNYKILEDKVVLACNNSETGEGAGCPTKHNSCGQDAGNIAAVDLQPVITANYGSAGGLCYVY